jgi:cobalt-zinc-cadmium efflux system protein
MPGSGTVGSVAVIVGGLLIRYLGWYYVDPLLGIVIGVMILRGALSLVLESVNILLEGAPRGVNLDEVAAAIRQVSGVEDIHDLHVWTITSGLNAISAHLVIADAQASRASLIIKAVNDKLNSAFHIQHSTFQTECESCPAGLICRVEPHEGAHGHHH